MIDSALISSTSQEIPDVLASPRTLIKPLSHRLMISLSVDTRVRRVLESLGKFRKLVQVFSRTLKVLEKSDFVIMAMEKLWKFMSLL
jgi:serine/threonine protein phosphatase PrpC